ncbi:MAG: hypothetical protein ABSH52_30780 [Terriglobia bacterium]|jgi:hypothetical protein
MKRIATVIVLVHLGIAAVYAQENQVKMTFSGTAASSTVNLAQPGTSNDEDNFAGNGTLGSFTVRNVRAISNSPTTPPSTCSGPNLYYFTESAGGGVFRFQDGSLLNVNLTQGDDCIDIVTNEAHCTVTFQITGGTGRFKNASGTLTFTETVVTVLSDASGNPVFFAATGHYEGTILGVAGEEDPPDAQR